MNNASEENKRRRGTLELRAKAREGRRDATAAEDAFWQAVRGGKIAGLRFRRQHVLETFVLDFYCPARRLAVEIDGGIHDEPEVAEHDGKRQNWLNATGIRVVRFRNADVLHHLPHVLAQLHQTLNLYPLAPLSEARGEGWRACEPG